MMGGAGQQGPESAASAAPTLNPAADTGLGNLNMGNVLGA